MNFYNENDPEKAAWLRELIRENVIAPGEVDERSIEEVEASELRGFTQCHFFAGIGVWSYALRLAGWPDSRPVWTGSCPCPSFSAAGKGGGFDDPRHLWPAWSRLIGICRPPTLFGEQADGAIGFGWLDLVQTDLERTDYSVGKAVLGACSVGAPHIRQRLYFLAESLHSERRTVDVDRQNGRDGAHNRREEAHGLAGTCGEVRSMADTADSRRHDARKYGSGPSLRSTRFEQCSDDGGMGESDRERSQPRQSSAETKRYRDAAFATGGNGVGMEISEQPGEWWRGLHRPEESGTEESAGPSGEPVGGSFVNGFWRNADWVLRKRWNRDDWEWCPTEPGTFPLVTGAPNRVLKLRGYGDAIVAQVAQAFIEAYLEIRP